MFHGLLIILIPIGLIWALIVFPALRIINDKGDFLNREDALKYAIDVGLLHTDSARYLTSTMLLTCSKSRARSSNPARGVRGSPMRSRPR
jgi:hypothetical protein